MSTKRHRPATPNDGAPDLRRAGRAAGRPIPLEGATRRLRRKRGFALVAVLWILVLLTAIASEFSYSMRTEVGIARNFKEASQAYYIAHSGLMRSVVELLRNTALEKNPEDAWEAGEGRIWRVNVPIPPQEFGAGEFTVHIDNAAGLIDLNTASEQLLRLMAGMMDASDRERAVIVDSIQDWRDRDDFHRLNGAEDDYYRSLADPYDCKNAPFDSVEELLLVRGMKPDLLTESIKSVLTVIPEKKVKTGGKARPVPRTARTNPGRININAAPRHLLEVLPQMTFQQVQSIIAFRTEADFTRLEEVRPLIGAETFSAISPYISLTLSEYYQIRAEGRVTGSSVKQNIRAVVQIDETLPLGYEIASWQEQYY